MTGGPSGSSPVASVTVTPANPTVFAGQTLPLTAVLRDQGGNVLTGGNVAWATSDFTVATVSAVGLLTAVKPGSLVVTASSGQVSGTNSVKVVTPTPVDGLVAYYPFDGNANDASGKASNGVVFGATPTADRFGNANHAYAFNGTSRIATTTARFTQTAQLSVSLWVSFPIRGGLRNIMTAAGWAVTATDINFHQVGLSVSSAGGGMDGLGATMGTGWTHFVGTYNGTTVRAYVNGVYRGLATVPGNLSGPELFLVFGSSWEGSLDDVRIYNRVLSDDEIQQLVHEGGWTQPSAAIATPLKK